MKPLFKKEYRLELEVEAKDYRPICLLPLISKVIEKSFHDQIQDYIQENELLV